MGGNYRPKYGNLVIIKIRGYNTTIISSAARCQIDTKDTYMCAFGREYYVKISFAEDKITKFAQQVIPKKR